VHYRLVGSDKGGDSSLCSSPTRMLQFLVWNRFLAAVLVHTLMRCGITDWDDDKELWNLVPPSISSP
jgi:hypothetical protein